LTKQQSLYPSALLRLALFALNVITDVVDLCLGRDSVVGVATRYGLDGPGIENWWGQEFPLQSRPALASNQPHVQWVPGLFLGFKVPGRGVDHPPHLAMRLKKE